MKAGKTKLIFSVFCLAAALTLAVFTVYAWFVTFTQVNTNGIDSVITSGDVLSFDIDYYKTSIPNGGTSTDEEVYVIGDKIEPDKEDGNRLKMPDYKPDLGNISISTAVLLDLKLTFAKPGIFSLAIKTNNDKAYDDSTFKSFTEDNYLSNIVDLRKVESNNNATITTGSQITVSTGATQYKFVSENFTGENDYSKKDSYVLLPEYTTTPLSYDSEGHQIEQHIYYLLDYMPQQINSIYTVLLQKFEGATLDTQIFFKHDIFFEIGKSKD